MELQKLQLRGFAPRSNYAIEELHGSRVLLIEDLLHGIRINSNETYELSLIFPNVGKTFMTRGVNKTVIAFFEDKVNMETVGCTNNFFSLWKNICVKKSTRLKNIWTISNLYCPYYKYWENYLKLYTIYSISFFSKVLSWENVTTLNHQTKWTDMTQHNTIRFLSTNSKK